MILRRLFKTGTQFLCIRLLISRIHCSIFEDSFLHVLQSEKNKNMQLLKKKRVLKSRTVNIHVVVEFSINVRITEIILISMCLRY